MLPTGREEGELSVTETGEASQRPSDGVLISLHGSERQKEREKTFVNKEFRAKPPKEDEPGERHGRRVKRKKGDIPAFVFSSSVWIFSPSLPAPPLTLPLSALHSHSPIFHTDESVCVSLCYISSPQVINRTSNYVCVWIIICSMWSRCSVSWFVSPTE